MTEWAVASIPETPADPADADRSGAMSAAAPASRASAAPLAVDDEPEEARPGTITTVVSPGEGDVDAAVAAPSDDPDDTDVDMLGPGAAPDTAARAVTNLRAVDGVQRYGEAVVRQVLDATLLREEPYEPPTRFS